MSLQEPYEPQDVDDLTLAFPAHVVDLMPAWEDIPSEFKGESNISKESSAGKWLQFQGDWFYQGFKDPKFWPKEGVDPEKALRHLQAIQGSFEPKHQHKVATVAYLASLWFEDWEDAT